MSMTPLRSFSSATASFSGRRTASSLSTRSPSSSWSMTNFCFACQRAVLDEIGDVDGQLALLDLVTREAPGVRRHRGHLHAFEAHLEVGVQRRRQQIDLARDLRRRVLVHLAFELHLGARLRIRRQPEDAAVHVLQVDGVVRLDPEVGEVRGAIDHAHRADAHAQRRRVRGGSLALGLHRLDGRRSAARARSVSC